MHADGTFRFAASPEQVAQRDDLSIERIALLNLTGHQEQALDLIAQRRFHPWEGGEGKVTGQFLSCHIELARRALVADNPEKALDHLNATVQYPHNLGEGKLANAEENDIHYYMGLAYRAMGRGDEAERYLIWATKGSAEPQQAFFYNDQQPDKIFYQGLAWRALGDEAKAKGRFNKLIDHGKKHLFDKCRIDYFAVSLPDLAIWEDDLDRRNKIHCYYVMGLGFLGLNDYQEAETCLKQALELDPSHQGVQTHLNILREAIAGKRLS